MHDFVSGLVSNKKKDHSVQTSVQRLGKRRREQKDIIPLTSMSLLVCVCDCTITLYCLLSPCATESRTVLGKGTRRTEEEWYKTVTKTAKNAG